jgi:hypothetical protein
MNHDAAAKHWIQHGTYTDTTGWEDTHGVASDDDDNVKRLGRPAGTNPTQRMARQCIYRWLGAGAVASSTLRVMAASRGISWATLCLVKQQSKELIRVYQHQRTWYWKWIHETVEDTQPRPIFLDSIVTTW